MRFTDDFSVFAEKVEGPFRGVADITVIPMQKGISQIGTWIGDVSENFETLKQLKKENKKLQKQVDQLTTENSNLQEENTNWTVFRICTSWIRLMQNIRKWEPV